ncbi:MAG TPA: biopolymer transporter ExbD [Allosphingosinicella sp.]|nr:biopolymer transporter ExbD [Allosphingosinicella sp.]
MAKLARRVPAFAAPVEEPIGTLNTTPLIDVMLVLLIMFIVTIPITTHKVAVDLPQGPPNVKPVKPVVHRLELDAAGRLSWDGTPVPHARLPSLLAAMRREPDGELHLRAHGDTPYVVVDQVLARVKRAGIERLGLIDNQRFADAEGPVS